MTFVDSSPSSNLIIPPASNTFKFEDDETHFMPNHIDEVTFSPDPFQPPFAHTSVRDVHTPVSLFDVEHVENSPEASVVAHQSIDDPIFSEDVEHFTGSKAEPLTATTTFPIVAQTIRSNNKNGNKFIRSLWF